MLKKGMWDSSRGIKDFCVKIEKQTQDWDGLWRKFEFQEIVNKRGHEEANTGPIGHEIGHETGHDETWKDNF